MSLAAPWRIVAQHPGHTLLMTPDTDTASDQDLTRALLNCEPGLRAICEASADGILIADIRTWRIALGNTIICEMLGYEPARMVNLRVTDILPANEALNGLSQLTRIGTSRTRTGYDLRLRRQDGAFLPVWMTGAPVKREGHDLVVCFIRDTSLHREAEISIRESEARFRAIFASVSDGIIIHDPASGAFLDVNPRVCELLGYSREDLIRMDFETLSAEPSPAGADLARLRIESAASGEPQSFEWRVRAKDGSVLVLEVALLRGATASGQTLLISTTHNITERKLAEEALQRSQMQLSDALRLARAARWEYDVVNDLFTFNDHYYAIFGFTAEDIGGYTVSSADYERRFIHPDDAPLVWREARAAMETSDASYASEFEHRILRKDGTTGYVAARLFIAQNDYHRTIRAYGVTQDITERKRDEEQLQRANRSLRILNATSEALVRAQREADYLETVCHILVSSAGYDTAWVGFAEQNPAKTVRVACVDGAHREFVEGARVSWGDDESGLGPVGTAIRTASPVVNPDFATNPSVSLWSRDAVSRGLTCNIALPLTEEGRAFGAVTLYSNEIAPFTAEEIALLTKFSNELAFGIIALRTRQAREESAARLRIAMDSTVQALANTLESRDPYTAGHQRRVAKLAAAAAQRLGIPAAEIEGIKLAATIHDIGKIQVPAEILNKPGRLTPLEHEVVRTHVRAGY
ncbi:MAG TPA: PAS domain S-box protein, partial [Steroidobacteraceae bacterium]